MARKSLCFAVGVALAGVVCSSSPASAQLAPSGASFLVAAVGVRGTASAYDPRTNSFLTVGAYGAVTGRVVKADGTFVSNPFTIDSAIGFAHFPSVAYSPDADAGRGAFLVTWHQSPGTGNLVRARLVSTSGVLLGTELTLGTEPTWWEAAPKVDYSAASKLFMVTWRVANYQIRAARISIVGQNLDANSNPGTPLAGAGILVTTTGGEQNPSIAYNPNTDMFLVVYADFLNGIHINCRLVAASTGSVGPVQVLTTVTGSYITDTTFAADSGRYLATWYQLPGGPTGRLVSADGTPSGNPFPLSTRFGSYDALAIAYNPATQTALMVGSDAFSLENGGVEISNGVPGSSAVLTNAGGPSGNFYPEVSASTAEPKWMLTTAHNFSSVVAQFATGTASGPPAMTRHPTSLVARLGQTATFAAAATGGSVQWQVRAPGAGDFSNIANATSTSLPVFVSPGEIGKLFRAVFTNAMGTTISTAASLTVTPTLNDFDGDGMSDALVYRPSNGTWYGAGAGTNQWLTVHGFGAADDIPLSGDLDGDGMTDIVVWRPATGTWFWLLSSNQYTGGGTIAFGGMGDAPLLGDVDGDRRADLIVWRPSTGTWYWLPSSTNYTPSSAGSRQWGIAALGDTPLIGDFDGDGRIDLTVWRPIEGNFYWLTSSSGYTAPRNFTFGGLGDQPFLADFDGDGRADMSVYRPSTGTWYWRTSAGAFGLRTFGGGGGDLPLLMDVDGDTRADITIWRPWTGEWFWLTSSSGYTRVRLRIFGGLGDSPVMR